jgi:two-component system cell cycle response regulator
VPAQTELDVLLAGHDTERAAATLRTVGWTVRQCDTAEQAVEACRADPPTVLVLDENAGLSADGCTVQAIKRDPDLFGIGIVVRCRSLGVRDAVERLAGGADNVLVDPVADAELVAAVRTTARICELQEELRGRAAALERLAFFDGLTDQPNRRFLDRQLAALISAAGRHGRPLSVVLFDIDRFKAVNDAHGHAIGDAVIAEVAARLAGRLRAEDHLGRFGGEEFLVLLPDTGPKAAAAVAEDLRAAVEATPIGTSEGDITVTVSGGWAVWEGEAPHELVSRADAALYEAKAAGRNAVRPAPAQRFFRRAQTSR